MKLIELINMEKGIGGLSSLKVNIKHAYQMSLMAAKMRPELEVFNQKRKELSEQFSNDQAGFRNALDDLLQAEVSLQIDDKIHLSWFKDQTLEASMLFGLENILVNDLE